MTHPAREEIHDSEIGKNERLHLKHHGRTYEQLGSSFTTQCPQDTSNIVEIVSMKSQKHNYSIQDGSNLSDQLRKAICFALHDAGFRSATPQAMESFTLSVREYMAHFSSLVRRSVVHCRRTRPLPQDFSFALKQCGVTQADLFPHIRASMPPSVVLPEIQAPLPVESSPVPFGTLFDIESELSEQTQKPYIPAHFPKLPSLHTFKSTGIFSDRHDDPRIIRELATKEGMQAEQALRKLMAAKKISARAKAARIRRSARNLHWQLSQEVWTETMEAILKKDAIQISNSDRLNLGLDGAEDAADMATDIEAEYGTIVNYDQKYWRHGARNNAEVPW